MPPRASRSSTTRRGWAECWARRSARFVLKPCVQLATPLWVEALTLLGGEWSHAAGEEMRSRARHELWQRLAADGDRMPLLAGALMVQRAVEEQVVATAAADATAAAAAAAAAAVDTAAACGRGRQGRGAGGSDTRRSRRAGRGVRRGGQRGGKQHHV